MFPFSKSAMNALNAYISPKRNISVVLLFYARVFMQIDHHISTLRIAKLVSMIHTFSCLSFIFSFDFFAICVQIGS